MQNATPLAGAELVPVVQGGANRKTTVADIAALAAGGGSLKFAMCQIRGNTGALLSSINVDSLTYLGTGNYELDITSAGFSNANYVAIGASSEYTFDSGALIVEFETVNATTIRIQTSIIDPSQLSGVLPYDSFIGVIIFGT
jgi:hypothetical protein